MHRDRSTRARGAAAIVFAAVLAAGAAACGSSSPGSAGPEGVVAEAFAKMEAKDLDGLSSLACAGQEERIREQLSGLGALEGGLLPGLDAQAMLDAIKLDTSKIEVGQPTVNGDAADVAVSGVLGISFDKEKVRPILRTVLEGQGQSMTDEQIDAMLGMLETYAQDVPVDDSVHLVREDGAWKICDAG